MKNQALPSKALFFFSLSGVRLGLSLGSGFFCQGEKRGESLSGGGAWAHGAVVWHPGAPWITNSHLYLFQGSVVSSDLHLTHVQTAP